MGRVKKEHFHAYLYFALQSLRNRPVRRHLESLRQWERLDGNAFERLRRQRLRTTLAFAAREIPLYASGPWQALHAAGRQEELEAWPLLERAALIEQFDSLLPRPLPKGLRYRRSSGSTGRPVRIAMNDEAFAWSWANEFRGMAWQGLQIGVDTLMLWGNRNPLLDWVRNRRVFLTQNIGEQLDQAMAYLLSRRPRLIWGLPSAVFQLARRLGAEYGPAGDKPLAPYIKLGGEQVYPFQRHAIEKYLGGRIMEAYGCTEVGPIAAECPHGSRHVFADHIHLEIVRDGEPVPDGEFGEIVVTTLTNRAMPLVRCQIGDRGSLSPDPCPCGLPLPVLDSLVSRTVDMAETAEGEWIHGSVLGRKLQPLMAGPVGAAVGQVLFRQNDRRSWTVMVESGEPVDQRLAEALAAMVRETCGEQCRVEVERRSAIRRENSGKFRYYQLPRRSDTGGAAEEGLHAALPRAAGAAGRAGVSSSLP